jgi:hypothetical protein
MDGRGRAADNIFQRLCFSPPGESRSGSLLPLLQLQTPPPRSRLPGTCPGLCC